MLSTVTRQAPSLSLQTFQEISGETLLLQAQGFQRSPLALASPDPTGFGTEKDGTERGGWPSNLDGQRPGKVPLKSKEQRCSPQAMSGEIPARSEAPKGASPV